MYPIGEAVLAKLVACYPSKLVVYTGHIDYKIRGTKYLGVVNPSELDQILYHAWAGVMVFPTTVLTGGLGQTSDCNEISKATGLRFSCWE